MNINLTLIGQMIAFVIFVWITKKYVWAPIIAALEERKTRIADGLASAEKGKHELVLAETKAVETLKEGKDKAQEFIMQAQKRSAEIVEEAKGKASEEGNKLVTAAKAQIEQEINQAREALRHEVAALAIAGAEQVLMREVDESAHKEVLEKLSAKL